MEKVTIKHLLEAGCHFGHQTKRWNPKMKNYVYGAKNGISIIDLTTTMHQIADACNFLQRTVANGGDVLFVGTKRQAQQIIRETAEKANMFYVSERWLGGTLTNNVTIRKSISKMREIDKLLESDEANSLRKKELSAHSRRGSKLHRDLDGIAEMKKLPAVMFVVDVCHDDIAVREARKLKIPIVAIVDTNGDPEQIDFPIAANDDAVKSIKVIVNIFSDAIAVAKELYHKRVAEEKSAKEREAAEKAEKAKAEKAKEEKAKTEKAKDDKAKTEKAKDDKIKAEKEAAKKKSDNNKKDTAVKEKSDNAPKSEAKQPAKESSAKANDGKTDEKVDKAKDEEKSTKKSAAKKAPKKPAAKSQTK